MVKPPSGQSPIAFNGSKGVPRRRLIVAVVLAGIVVCVGATFMYVRGSRQSPVNAIETFAVKRGPLDIAVSEGGALQAERMERVRSQVHNSVNIISIVSEGTTVTEEDVKNGKVLVTLDSAQIQDNETKQEIAVEGAAAYLTQAKENLQIQQKQNESDIRAAELNEKFAKADLASYLGKELADSLGNNPDFTTLDKNEKLGGAALQKKVQLENDVRVTLEQVKTALDTYDWTRKLYDKKYVTGNELQRDQLALMQQNAAVEQANLCLRLFLMYELPKQAETLYAAVREKRLETERVRSRANSQAAQSLAQLKSAESSYNVQKQQFDDTKKQLEYCQIKADKPGLVVYASSTDNWRRNRAPIEEGTSVYERQEIIYLPDLSSSVARVRIHESAVKKIKAGQPTTITVDAYPDLVLHGTVKDVAPLPDPPQGQNQDVKVFTTTVSIDGDYSYLKPGISCRATITVAKLPDAIYVPLQAIAMAGDDAVCIVVRPDGQERRKVALGESDDNFAVITSGLSEGDRVMLNPGVQTADVSAKAQAEKPAENAVPAAKDTQTTKAAPETARADAGSTDAAKSDATKAADPAGQTPDAQQRRPRGGRRGSRPDAAKSPAPDAEPSQ